MWDTTSEQSDVSASNPLINTSWLWTPLGDYAGSAMGCDSNMDRYIGVSDLTCTVLRYFGATSCSGVSAASSTPAVVSAPSAVVATAQAAVDVPVSLQTNGSGVGAIAFTLQVDPAIFVLDETDADEDGIPDMVSLNVPASMMQMVQVDLETGKIDVMASGVMPPLPTLNDGIVAIIRLTGGSQAAGAFAPLQLTNVSLGDTDGGTVEAEVVMVMPEGPSQGIFLPLITR